MNIHASFAADLAANDNATAAAPANANHHCASSPEPMQRPDHKAKKHGKPRWPGFPGARKHESIGGGYFIFKRGDRTGRIENRGVPFEHSTFIAAQAEASRLQKKYGGQFEVYGSLTISPELDAEWDYDPHGEARALEVVA